MTEKPKRSATPPPRPKAPQRDLPLPNPLRQGDQRWQRSVRYGWDKGGGKGGR